MVQKQLAFDRTRLKQTFSLSDISPKWAKRFGEHQQEKHLPRPLSIVWLRWWLEIIYPTKCVVGEAYGFTRDYTWSCKERGEIGEKFSIYFTLNLASKLEENKQRFINHWNKEHT